MLKSKINLTEPGLLKLPKNINSAIDIINAGGFSAYAVGGCVRDMLLGKVPNDYDITTSAEPEEIISLFSKEYTVIPTGIEHGTVTVFFDNEALEITTFRTEGKYSDHRHPDYVAFTRTLSEDLSRRDLTVNAMAFNEQEGLIDLFGGLEDIQNGIIRAVGDAEKRFTEDALRIFRAIRFSAVLGFEIEDKTSDAVKKLKSTLRFVAPERLGKELAKLLTADKLTDVLNDYSDVLFEVIPELLPAEACAQHSVYHKYDVWRHTLAALENTPNELELRCAVLLHDIGKPYVKYTDEKGFDHFKGHVEKSTELSDMILKRFAFPAEVRNTVGFLILHHEERIPLSKERIKLLLNTGDPDRVKKLFKVQLADNLAKTEAVAAERGSCELEALRLLNEITEKHECFSISGLEISGSDLLAVGAKGKEIGTLLDLLLLEVITEKTENKRDALLTAVDRLLIRIREKVFSFIPLKQSCTTFCKRYREYLNN